MTSDIHTMTPEEEVAHERADEIIWCNTHLCVSCKAPMLSKANSVESSSGYYHSGCVDGRSDEELLDIFGVYGL